ncbi:hypothetical protein Indivirus_1_33 [Indivirus ILV1]|uniref:Zeta toxin n=1 Tax=Indivirus ILV1 TaxID=1977633 RepID=A0A1V0SCG7_9VIRU|nr:hypothetical protein Indivirus_1_33 [Indivirus ILV1]
MDNHKRKNYYSSYIKYKNKYLNYKQVGGNYDQALMKWKKYYIGPDNRTFILRIGPMGSGKTTATNKFIDNILGWNSNIFPLIDLDKLVTESDYYKARYRNGMTNKQLEDLWWNAQQDIGGYKIMDNLFDMLLHEKRLFSMESTGNWFCPSHGKIIKCYQNGYDVVTIFCFIPFFELWKRIEVRAKKEGRGVDITSSIANIKQSLLKTLDLVYLSRDFYLLSNYVPSNSIPIILMHSKLHYTTDAKEDDNHKCKKIFDKNIAEIDKIIQEIQTNNAFYTDNKCPEILRYELEFLEKIKLMV